MKHLTPGVQHVLLATDFTEPAGRAFDAAVRAARLYGARLSILHANEEEAFFANHGSRDVSHFLEHIANKRIELLADLEANARALGIDATAVTRQGQASEAIIAYADEVDAGLIVLGAVGARGVRRLLTGSTAKQVTRRAHRPVLIVPSQAVVRPAAEGGSYERLLYPTDLSAASHDGLRVAADLVQRSDATLTLLHVLKLPTFIPSLPGEPPIALPGGTVEGLEAKFRGELDEVARQLPEAQVSKLVEVHGDPAEGIAEVAGREQIDLIVIPRHSHRSVAGYFFGRTAENLSRIAPCPVLAFSPNEG
ncbi:MAG: universal stress protein [Deltaproteobacteria bacterium]|nr:universal stress protein [Deltaproteobacteria bacterium]MCB9789171.1 universal stress protein [Deltaproteobacteria bacterium]